MRSFCIFLSIIVISAVSLFFSGYYFDEFGESFLENSGPYVGADYPIKHGSDGTGIKIAVIDTGVNFGHPDFVTFGKNSDLMKGYDFVDLDKFPQDVNGHGTQVAGIISANGQLQGIAPEAEIFAYRVSEDGESVPSKLIVKAVEQAMLDDVDIINISLGVNMTHNEIEKIVNKAVNSGIIIVAAAGNNGPDESTIGSPARNPNVITVGATYNNRESSMVSTFEVGEKYFQVLPMLGTNVIPEPIIEEIEFVKFSRESDFENIDVNGKIALAQRGGEASDEIVYFSDKEEFAAKNGAKAIIVYNNKPGIFFGELTHEFVPEGYQPSIPSLSMTMEDGIKLRQMIDENTIGSLNVFNHPDFIATFSSRGPVSPFYFKPDLVAPGVFVNTTSVKNYYNITSGTSYAAPHVAGAAALLLNKNPDFTPEQVKSILITTSDIIADEYGNKFDFNTGGSGRLNITTAYNSEIVFLPPTLEFNLSHEKNSQIKYLEIQSFEKQVSNLQLEFPESDLIEFEYKLVDDLLQISAKSSSSEITHFEDRVIITHNDIQYQIPTTVRVSEATMDILKDDSGLLFQIKNPSDWTYAKITITNINTLDEDSFSITPEKNSPLKVYTAGEYWVKANIKADKISFDVYETITVDPESISEQSVISDLIISERPLIILVVIFGIVTIVGIRIKNR
jgi:minor extracellular serine protease Vpr